MRHVVQPWWFGVLGSILGLTGTLALAIADMRVNPAPCWSDPLFWLWIASPSIAWSAASYYSRGRMPMSPVIVIGAVASHVGGFTMLWCDASRARVPGGMNPFASNSLSFTLLAVAFLQWVLFSVIVLSILIFGRSQRGRPSY